VTLVSPSRVRDRLRSAFWLVPALCAASAVVLAVALVAVDGVLAQYQTVFLFPGPPEGARSVLGAIIGAMISFTGLVFSITIVALQLTSSQFSPRVLRTFIRDRTIQWTLGVFVATFVYAMTVVRDVLGTNGDGAFVPRIAVTVAFLLVLASVALFIHYINHIANMMRIASIIAGLGGEARKVIRRRFPADLPPQAPVPPVSLGSVVPNRRAGVVVSVNEAEIVEQAAGADRTVALVPRVGDFVPAGAPLCRLSDIDPDRCTSGRRAEDAGFEDRLLGLVALDDERSMEQDLAFAFRQLVDIAEKALSPGVNDPTTACQAIDVVHDLLRTLATRELPSGRFADSEGCTRLVVPQYGFDDYLHTAMAELWHHGAKSTQVPERLAVMLRDLICAARPEHRPAARSWLRTVESGGET
jgi:uncharacterized membrane protein